MAAPYLGGSKQIKFPVADLLDATSDAKAMLRVYEDGDFLSVKNVIAYGADPTGVADSSTAILAADAAAEDAGGDVYFPAGTYRVDNQLVLDYTDPGGGAIHTMRPRRWIGDGNWNDATASTAAAARGTIIESRYTSGPNFLIKPRGGFELTGITFKEYTSTSHPFVKVTNTTVNIHDCSFIGHSSKVGQTCVKPAVVFGGTTLDAIGNNDDSPFQGYGSVFRDSYCNNVQHLGEFRMFANDVKVHNLVAWGSCGGAEAFLVNPVMSNQYAAGFGIHDCTIEMSGYNRFVTCNQGVNGSIQGNGLYDEFIPTFTAVAATDILTVTQDPGDLSKVFLKSSGTLPGGLSSLTGYYVIRLSSTTCKLATSYANAQAGTAINITDAGSGTHTMTYLDTNGMIFLTASPGIRIDSSLMPTVAPPVKADGTSSYILISTTQFEETVFTNPHPLRSDNFRSAISLFDGTSASMVSQPASTVTETASDTVGLLTKTKSGVVLERTTNYGSHTIGGTVLTGLYATVNDAPSWELTKAGLALAGDGGAFIIDTGTGGSFLTQKCYGLILVNQAGTEFARIESSGVVKLQNLPTSDPGVAGQLWNSSGTLRIS
jgi:hypothetical protein